MKAAYHCLVYKVRRTRPACKFSWRPRFALCADGTTRRCRFSAQSESLRLQPEQTSFQPMSAVAEIKSAAGGLVVSNPGILGGTPVFRGTRLPVQTLFDYLADGLSLDYFLETFEGVTREQTTGVLRYGWERIAAEFAR